MDQPVPRKTSRLRRILFGVVAFLFAFLICFLLLEVVLRVVGVEPKSATVLSAFFEFDPHTGWRGRPDVSIQFITPNFDTRVSHGADGYRVCDPKPEAEAEIWCFGDSFTWGWGASDGETYVDRLNELAGPSLRFRNLGHCGFSAIQEFFLLDDLLKREKPPLAAFIFFMAGDLPENVDDVDLDPPRPILAADDDGSVDVRYHPVPEPGFRLKIWLRRHSLAYNFLHFHLTNARRRFRNVRKTGDALVPPPTTEEEWTALRYSYERMKKVCEDKGVDLFLIYQPDGGETGEVDHPELRAFHEAKRTRFFRIADELGIQAVNLRPSWVEYVASPDAKPLRFPTDAHPNPIGHRLIGDGTWKAYQEARGR